MWGLHGSPQAALREVGLMRDCSRKEIRISTGVTVVGMEKKEMDVTGGKTIQMEFPSSATYFALFSLIDSDLLLLWMRLLGIQQESAQARGQVRRSPLLPLPSGSSRSLSGWLSRAGGPHAFSSAGPTRQPEPRPTRTAHAAATAPALRWTQLGKWKEAKVFPKARRQKHREAIHAGERRFWESTKTQYSYYRIPARDAQSESNHENAVRKTQERGTSTKHGLFFFSKCQCHKRQRKLR